MDYPGLRSSGRYLPTLAQDGEPLEPSAHRGKLFVHSAGLGFLDWKVPIVYLKKDLAGAAKPRAFLVLLELFKVAYPWSFIQCHIDHQ